jgi:hypothetical protein
MPVYFLSLITAAALMVVLYFAFYHPTFLGKLRGEVAPQVVFKGNFLSWISLYFFAVLICFVLSTIVIHQFGPLGMIGGPQFATDAHPSYHAFMREYGNAFRTFKHGALHAFMTSLFFVFPLLLFTKRNHQLSWRPVIFDAIFWSLSLTVCGGIISAWY